jgi:polysaccharide biosynthesis PFTS motif protein
MELFDDFTRRGGLATVRAVTESIKLFVSQEIAKFDPGTERTLLRTSLIQSKFEHFLKPTVVSKRMIVQNSKSGILMLPLPSGWIEYLNKSSSLDSVGFKVDKLLYYSKSLNLQLKSFGRLVLVLLTKKKVAPLLKVFGNQSIIVIGHVKESIYFDGDNEDDWTYHTWSKKNEITGSSTLFLTEIQFMQLLIMNLSREGEIRRIKNNARHFLNALRRVFAVELSIEERVLAFEQIFYSELVSVAFEKRTPLKIQFTESIGCRRPYWSYEAERLGATLEFRFFANCATLSLPARLEVPSQFALYTWRKILAVSDWQIRAIPSTNLLGQNVSFANTGVPWFKDHRDFKIPELDRYLVIFDYEVPRNYFSYSSLMDLGLADPKCNRLFLQAILEVCSSANLMVYHKQKRELPIKLQSLNPLDRFEEYLNRDTYKIVPPSVSPHRLISRAIGVISLPPTSTGLIGKQMGVPSIYFDPTGNVCKNDPALDSVTLVNSKEGLSQWVSSLKGTS